MSNDVDELYKEVQHVGTWLDLDALLGPIKWAWSKWLVQAMLHILAANSGDGKSAVLEYVCGCFVSRWDWPDGTKYEGDPGSVIWCESEAAQAIHLKRAKDWGLPLNRFLYPTKEPLDDFSFDNNDHKGRLAEMAFYPDVKAIVIDSLSGMNKRRKESSEDMMQIGTWLAELARDSRRPILLSHHLHKRGPFDASEVDLDRVRGSTTIVQPARLVWAIDNPNLQEKEWRRLRVIKSNLDKFPQAIGMNIDEKGVHFGTAPEIPRVETVTEKAINLLLVLLADEPMKASEIEEKLKQAGISWRSANRAKESLGIVSVKRNGIWWWSLPAKDFYHGD